MSNLYFIRNCGCDDTTNGLARMTDEQLSFFKNIIENINKNSTYECMPVIEAYKIDESVLREPTDGDWAERIMLLDDRKYVFIDTMMYYGDTLERVIWRG